ncbi:MAG: DUF4173 domain-containing protein [Ruminococcus sp.]|uniref:DUF4153 domain-containing protein n=1 Tax=Ruminococcus sp. TaxID=41978 RepID=UPI001B1CCE7C|nr:DUF4173 domain-containing protein [Ruminococcus sp.]MBO7474688.1 DUF4173 domain-containing protein [Ruminococcus sp.]
MNDNYLGEVQIVPEYQAVALKKEKPEYSRAEVVLSVFAFTAAFFIMRYVVFNAMGFLTTGLMFAVITGAIVYMKKRKCSFTRFNRLHGAVLYIFSLVFSITANDYIKELNAFFILGAGAYLVYSVSAGNKETDRYLPFAMCKALFEYPFSHFGKQWAVTQDRLSKTRAGSNVKYILTGLLITVPVTAVVAALLMSADDGLMNILSGIYEKVFSLEMCDIIEQLIFAVPFSMYLFGMLYANAHRSKIKPLEEQGCIQKLYGVRFISNLVMYTAVTPLCILYVLFFISQANYFLSAFSGSLPEGYTYADYARQGFFELCAVAVINLAVLCGISLFSKKTGREKPAALKIYSVVLSVFTIILIATAMSKMVMYIYNYGLTELRVYTSWFMVLLALVFVLIIIKQFRYDMKFTKRLSAVFVVMFAVLCFSRPESVIARYNIAMYNSGYLEELDRDAILEMSADGLLAAYNEGALTAEVICEYSEEYDPFDRFGNYNLSSVILGSKMK